MPQSKKLIYPFKMVAVHSFFVYLPEGNIHHELQEQDSAEHCEVHVLHCPAYQACQECRTQQRCDDPTGSETCWRSSPFVRPWSKATGDSKRKVARTWPIQAGKIVTQSLTSLRTIRQPSATREARISPTKAKVAKWGVGFELEVGNDVNPSLDHGTFWGWEGYVEACQNIKPPIVTRLVFENIVFSMFLIQFTLPTLEEPNQSHLPWYRSSIPSSGRQFH